MNVSSGSAFGRSIFLILGLILSSISVPGVAGQKVGPSKAEVRQKVAAIIRERLRGTVTVVNGVEVQTQTPPSPKAVETVRQFGDEAVPVLESYLRSRNPRERAAGIEFLGLLGGRRIVGPLQKVITSEKESYLRILALRWITTAPPEFTIKIIREAARSDSDKQVREAAQTLLNGLPVKAG